MTRAASGSGPPAADSVVAARRAIEAVFRIERARLIAGLVRTVGDVGAAEDLAQEAMLAALAEWPKTGVPRSPGAWLTTTARRRAIDGLRYAQMSARRQTDIQLELEGAGEPPATVIERALDDPTGDDLLNLMFIACHPLLSAPQRTTLTLRLVAGLEVSEIARAFLTGEAAIAQRLVRAKRLLRSSGLPFDPPRGPQLAARLSSVLEVIYLIFNEGYAATRGEDLMRPRLCLEARRLGRILAQLAPNAPEVFGLLALMELHSSREATRVAADGTPIPLTQQDRSRWNRDYIRLGLAALARAEALGGEGPYTLQAAIVACHARAPSAASTAWRKIADLYDRLAQARPSPVIELNRAIAHGMAFGPEIGLQRIAAIADSKTLQRYAPTRAAAGDMLFRLGRCAAAEAEFRAAAALSENAPEQRFLLARADACAAQIAGIV